MQIIKYWPCEVYDMQRRRVVQIYYPCAYAREFINKIHVPDAYINAITLFMFLNYKNSIIIYFFF